MKERFQHCQSGIIYVGDMYYLLFLLASLASTVMVA